jgi:hypothetical protein
VDSRLRLSDSVCDTDAQRQRRRQVVTTVVGSGVSNGAYDTVLTCTNVMVPTTVQAQATATVSTMTSAGVMRDQSSAVTLSAITAGTVVGPISLVHQYAKAGSVGDLTLTVTSLTNNLLC